MNIVSALFLLAGAGALVSVSTAVLLLAVVHTPDKLTRSSVVAAFDYTVAIAAAVTFAGAVT